MALAFYMDEHIPRPITIGLRVRSIDVLTAQEDGRAEFDDPLLLNRAAELRRVMVSFDADMLREATRRQRVDESFAGIAFAHPSTISIGECISELEILAKVGEIKDVDNQVVYLPL